MESQSPCPCKHCPRFRGPSSLGREDEKRSQSAAGFSASNLLPLGRVFSSSRPWGLCSLGRKSRGGRKRRAAAACAGLWAGWEPAGFVLGGGPDGSMAETPRASLCVTMPGRTQALPQEGRRPELRAPPPLQEGDPVKGEAQGCPGLRTELCPEPRGLSTALRPAPAQSKRLPVASGRGGGRVRGSEHRLGPQADPVSVLEGL
ncbi:uncharacterized protein LOC123331529 isoform X2 [Bubalus bubalis]|uniref:uncharacterized protein LOC123331529 isoform X2 n=1 Tax=Bubalus bubalis TaxID=89462 RepID=UPI001E1B7A40|nr:uncharacterized protein LOC123331529 isoform X2 [Bubalus bubalis]